MLVKSFYHEGARYSLRFNHGQFMLTMNPSLDYFKQQYGEAGYLYIDEEITDDVGIIKNPFFVINQTVRMIARHVFDAKISYFYFKSSTPRKDKIYPWLGKKIVAELTTYKKQFGFVWHEHRFDFWLNAKKTI